METIDPRLQSLLDEVYNHAPTTPLTLELCRL